MASHLPTRLEGLEAQRRDLLAELATWKPEGLAARPTPARWCALEILEHLVLAEREILAGLPDPTTLAPKIRRPRHRVRYALVWLVLWLRIPVKVPSPAMAPSGGGTLPELAAQWDATHAWVRSLPTALGPRVETEALFRHPVAGPLTLAQALALDRLHLRVHRSQLRRLRRTLGT